MKANLISASILAIAFFSSQAVAVLPPLVPVEQDDCLVCTDDIVTAIEICNEADGVISIVECITDVIGATSDCLTCICDILTIVLDYDETETGCVDEDPGDCIYCVDEITAAVEQCPNETTIECVEDALGATSTCLDCVCDILNILEGGDGTCGGDVPTDAPTTAGGGTAEAKFNVDMVDDRGIARDCIACVTEIVDAVNQCDGAVTTDEIVRCVEIALGATSDCIVCICDVLGALAGDDDLSDCDPDGGNPLF